MSTTLKMTGWLAGGSAMPEGVVLGFRREGEAYDCFQIRPEGLFIGDGTGDPYDAGTLLIPADGDVTFHSVTAQASLEGPGLITDQDGLVVTQSEVSITSIAPVEIHAGLAVTGAIQCTDTEAGGIQCVQVGASVAGNFKAINSYVGDPSVPFLAPIEFTEQTAPAAPAADKVRIYAEDNGSGKTRLMAKFATGAAQVIATQP